MEGIIKNYSIDLTNEFGKGFQYKELYKMLQFYNLCGKVGAVHRQLTWNHYLKLLPLKDINEINYYISVTIRDNLSYRKLAERIKSDEYSRLPLETKIKLNESKEVNEFVVRYVNHDNIAILSIDLVEQPQKIIYYFEKV